MSRYSKILYNRIVTSYAMELQKDLFPMKITIRGIGYKYLKISLFSGHGLFVNINQHKSVY